MIPIRHKHVVVMDRDPNANASQDDIPLIARIDNAQHIQ